VIGGLIALWWLRAPETPGGQRISLVNQSATRIAATAQPLTATVIATPVPTTTPAPTASQPPTTTPTDIPLAGPVKHIVKPGDTLIAIAATYDAAVKDIADANSLQVGGVLRIGQELLIPVAGPSGGPGPTATPDNSALMYVVQAGDTISTIADRFDSTTGWILEANNMKPADVLRIGRALLIPRTAATPAPTVTPEDTPTPSPTTGPRLPAPPLLAPADEATLDGNSTVLLTWAAPGILTQEEWYVVTVSAVGSDQIIPSYWTRATSWRLPADLRVGSQSPTEFSWRVQVRSGSPSDPGSATSATSELRRFSW
jgi:LysM repeat protein